MLHVLCLTTIPTHPEIAGNRSRITHLLKQFEREGASISIAYLHDSSTETEYDAVAMNAFWKNPVSIIFINSHAKDPSSSPQVLEKIQIIQEELNPDIVILTYPFLSPLLELFPEHCLKLIDTMDVFYQRNTLLREHAIHVPSRSQDFSSKMIERNALERADGVIAIQENDSSYYRKLLRIPVYLIEHAPRIQVQARTQAVSNKLLFIGSKSYIGLRNVVACITTFLPVIQERCPDVELIVAGDVHSLIPKELRSKATFIGRVSNLKALYESCDIAVSTDVFATGLSIKNVSALSYGIPLVTTSIGARGLEHGAAHAYLLADTPNEFADFILQLFTDPQKYAAISSEALIFAQSMHERITANIQHLMHDVSSKR